MTFDSTCWLLRRERRTFWPVRSPPRPGRRRGGGCPKPSGTLPASCQLETGDFFHYILAMWEKNVSLSKRLFSDSPLLSDIDLYRQSLHFFIHLKWVVSGVPDTIYRCLRGKKFWNADKEKFWPNVTKKNLLAAELHFLRWNSLRGQFLKKQVKPGFTNYQPRGWPKEWNIICF